MNIELSENELKFILHYLDYPTLSDYFGVNSYELRERLEDKLNKIQEE